MMDDLPVYRSYIEELGIDKTCSCSSAVVSNAANNDIKYIIKYSNIANIARPEYCLKILDFCIVYRNRIEKLYADMDVLQEKVQKQLPIVIRWFATARKIPYTVCDIDYKIANIEEPRFRFLYVSPAGKSRRSYSVEVTQDVMTEIESEIYVKITKTGHSRAQRSAMTNDLREAIKKRDNYTCCICGNSVFKEPNLLLEVDHIVPVSKGGKTVASNLQTLCWRCNRKKSNKEL